MQAEVSVDVDAPPAAVWSVVSDIENSATTISGIDSVEVLERPPEGLAGLKWRETRTIFGKSATEIMWITDVVEGASYMTEASSHGSVYRTRVAVEGAGDRSVLTMRFSAEPVSIGARVMAVAFGRVMRGSIRKALAKDLNDVKGAAEARARSGPDAAPVA